MSIHVEEIEIPRQHFFQPRMFKWIQRKQLWYEITLPLVKEVKSFLGMTNFYRRVISHYADKAHGLTK